MRLKVGKSEKIMIFIKNCLSSFLQILMFHSSLNLCQKVKKQQQENTWNIFGFFSKTPDFEALRRGQLLTSPLCVSFGNTQNIFEIKQLFENCVMTKYTRFYSLEIEQKLTKNGHCLDSAHYHRTVSFSFLPLERQGCVCVTLHLHLNVYLKV